jgi:hypothetical protein
MAIWCVSATSRPPPAANAKLLSFDADVVLPELGKAANIVAPPNKNCV